MPPKKAGNPKGSPAFPFVSPSKEVDPSERVKAPLRRDGALIPQQETEWSQHESDQDGSGTRSGRGS